MSSPLNQAPGENPYVIAKEKDVLELLDCPVCMEQMFPPIYQCERGHPLCSKCKNDMVRSICPSCRCELGDIRSLPFEKLAESLRFACKYHEFGCFEYSSCKDKLQHEKTCKLRPYGCPIPFSGCNISGNITRISSHMKNLHGCKVLDHPIEYEYTYTESRNGHSWDFIMCKSFGEEFCLYVKSESRERDVTFTLYLLFLGDKSEVEDYHYRVQVQNGHRRTSHEGIPYSIRDGYEKAEANEDGLIINSKAARLFSLIESGKRFWVTCMIWKQ